MNTIRFSLKKGLEQPKSFSKPDKEQYETAYLTLLYLSVIQTTKLKNLLGQGKHRKHRVRNDFRQYEFEGNEEHETMCSKYNCF